MNHSDFTLLVADDDQKIRKMLATYLKGHGFHTIEAEDGQRALDLFYEQSGKVDLILLDVMMPVRDGFSVLEELRESSLVPVMMVTARDEEYDQLKGFRAGADDYISKPFSPTILMARIESVLRRTNPKAKAENYTFGAVEVDLRGKSLKVGGHFIALTAKEFDLLTYLINNAGEVLSRNQILNGVWSYDYEGDPRTVDTHIKQLRAKLGEYGYLIRTVHGMGYLWDTRR